MKKILILIFCATSRNYLYADTTFVSCVCSEGVRSTNTGYSYSSSINDAKATGIEALQS